MLSFYRFVFILNAVASTLFLGYVFYNVTYVRPRLNDNDILGLSIVAFVFVIYLLSDVMGLSMVKKLIMHEGISTTRVVCTWINLGIQFLIQLLFAYGLYTGIKTLVQYYQSPLAFKTYTNVIFLYGLLLLIFISTAFNMITSIWLIRKLRINHREMNQTIAAIGSTA